MITDLSPELKQAALAGRQQGTSGGTQPMEAGGAALAQKDAINMQTAIARSIYTNKAKEQHKGKIEQLAKQNHASSDQIKELVSDKVLDKIINQPDVQKIINEQIKVYLSTFKLGQKEQDKSVNELISLGIQTAGSAGLAYAYP